VTWGFIAARALTAPVCAMYLATLGKRALVRREMYGNLLLTIGGTIQQIIENLQLAADERLIEPLWRMQVLVDRASRAQTDEEMDRFDDELLKALSGLRLLRDRLAHGAQGVQAAPAERGEDGVVATSGAPAVVAARAEGIAGADPPAQLQLEAEQAVMPTARYNGRRVTARLEATR
jgi:hypothetical protein